MATRDELLDALRGRYGEARRVEKGRILTEFAAVTGYHRKHAARVLRATTRPDRSRPRPERRLYDEAVREALILLWEASDRICGKRLKPLVPMLLAAMERHGHLALDAGVRARLETISAATIDRALRPVRVGAGGAGKRRAAPSLAVRRSVPVRTFADWDDPAPGFVEADLVAHGGPSSRGSFVQTLVLTDIATGWTECAPLLFREQRLLGEVLTVTRAALPFPLLGLDTDNDGVFMNETIATWCSEAQVAFTRSRPYRKNDQAWVEQKNGAVVRRMVGYRRFEGVQAAAALARLYRSVRLFVNFFQPSFRLVEKRREGARVHKRYDAPMTPHQRLLADKRVPQALKDAVEARHAELDPVRLLGEIRAAQSALVAIADGTPHAEDAAAGEGSLERFLEALRHAWKEGEARPVARAKPKAPRGRRRPDPLATVTVDLHAWFEERPDISGRALLERLQAAHPGGYPDGLLRTVQRRLKGWRAEKARALVFAESANGIEAASAPAVPGDALCRMGAPRVAGDGRRASDPSLAWLGEADTVA